MQSKFQPKTFKFAIAHFEPRKIQKAKVSLQRHLDAAMEHHRINEGYREGILKPKEVSFLEKISNLVKGKV